MNFKIANIFKGDKGIWTVFFVLCIISIVEVFSASSTLSFKSHNYMSSIIYHTGTILGGLVITIVMLNIPCKYYKALTPILLVLNYAALIYVLIWGENVNGANRAIPLPGFTLQPSEFSKGIMVLATAQILSALQREDGKGADPNAMKYILLVSIPTVLLIGVENLSTGVLLFGVIVLMMVIGRVPVIQLGKLFSVIILGAALVFAIASLDKGNTQEEEEAMATMTLKERKALEKEKAKHRSAFEKVTHRFATWRNRIINHSASQGVSAEDYDIEANYQIGHANIAIASSGIIGRGPGNSVERDYLPQAFSDFIYAIIVEEMGIVGAAVVVFLYVILLFRAARIARQCENNFPAFLVMGLALMLVCQASINMLVAVDMGPVTGQPLPLISKGGSSTIASCAYIGAILSVSRWAKKTEKKTKTKQI